MSFSDIGNTVTTLSCVFFLKIFLSIAFPVLLS
jgi:hypothetical protein